MPAEACFPFASSSLEKQSKLYWQWLDSTTMDGHWANEDAVHPFGSKGALFYQQEALQHSVFLYSTIDAKVLAACANAPMLRLRVNGCLFAKSLPQCNNNQIRQHCCKCEAGEQPREGALWRGVALRMPRWRWWDTAGPGRVNAGWSSFHGTNIIPTCGPHKQLFNPPSEPKHLFRGHFAPVQIQVGDFASQQLILMDSFRHRFTSPSAPPK